MISPVVLRKTLVLLLFASLVGCGQMTQNSVENLGGIARVIDGEVRVVDFSKAKINDGALTIVQGLEYLENLDLANTDITDAGLAHVYNLPSIIQLNLSYTKITDEAFKSIDRLKGLQYLYLSGTQVTGSGLADLEVLKPSLHILGLNSSAVTDDAFALLQGFGNEFTSLYVSDTQITDAALVHIGQIHSLEEFIARNTAITDAGLEHLTGMEKLRRLSLSGTQITDEGLVHLASLTKLQELDVKETEVTEEGIKKLSEALPECLVDY